METAYYDVVAKASGGSAFLTRIDEGQIVPLIQFGGQGADYWLELVMAYQESLPARQVIQTVARDLRLHVAAGQETGLFPHGFEPIRWLEEPTTLPSAEYLASSVISQSLIFLTQVAQVVRLQGPDARLAPLFAKATGYIGHSQGVMTGLCFAHRASGAAFSALVTKIATFFFWQGIRMQQVAPPCGVGAALLKDEQAQGEGTPGAMAALIGLEPQEVESLLAEVNSPLASDAQIYISLVNGWNRVVCSAPIKSLMTLRAALRRQEVAWAKDPILKRTVEWNYVVASAPFHSPYMQTGMAAFRQDLQRCDIRFDAADLHVPVYHTSTGANLQASKDLLRDLLEMQWVMPVHWPCVTRLATAQRDVTHIVDFGPGEAAAKLTGANRAGDGIAVVAAATTEGQRILTSPDVAIIPWGEDWRKYRPRLVALSDRAQRTSQGAQQLEAGDGRRTTDDGRRLCLDNAYTRYAKLPPIFGAGMTPTSVETDIVAAAANAGYLQEWAGGGQVTDDIWAQRRKELLAALQTGRGVVFNALYLDPYLWKLHFPAILEQKRKGFPYIGLTIAAGIPDVDEAAQILRTLHAHGLWLNALKPGNDAMIAQALQIADATPELTILFHVEGGKAGGHHSWEDLEGLVLRNYAKIRRRKNVLLCVGGGIAHPVQAAAWLMGDWHGRTELSPMPVDAVFLGTRLMACKEAKTSPAVKELLAELPGDAAWVRPGESKGGITSQKSQLNADVYFATTSAAKAGALLDLLAGRPEEAILARKEEIVRLLNATCKPYFGELTEMTYAQVLARMTELMAPGHIADHLPHDGSWYDVSYRERAEAWEARIVARFARREEHGAKNEERNAEFGMRTTDDGRRNADDGRRTTDILAQTTLLHPEDVRYFLHLCRRPGKPVNFVPIIDADVRRWYKADSLWQSHDPRYAADAVFFVPGPASVTGITKIDEPIAEILNGFERAVALAIGAETLPSVSYPGEVVAVSDAALQTGAAQVQRRGKRRVLTIARREGVTPDYHEWLSWIMPQGTGALRALLSTPQWWFGNAWRPNPIIQLLGDVDAWSVTLDDGEFVQLTAGACALRRRRDGGEVNIAFCPGVGHGTSRLQLPFVYDCTNGTAPVAFAADVVQRQVKAFYQGIWPTSVPTERQHLQIGQTFHATTEVTRASILAYTAATGDTPQQLPSTIRHKRTTNDGRRTTVLGAPPTMTVVHCWEPFATSLLACGDAGNLLDLVHLSHSYRFVAPTSIAEGDRVTSELTIASIEQKASGLMVRVVGSIVRRKETIVEIESTFFMRGAVDNEQRTTGEGMRTTDDGRRTTECGRRTTVLLPNTYTAFRSTVQAPQSALAYALASGDHNPIHTDTRLAAIAGFDRPIMHGMWTAAAIARETTQWLGDSDATRLTALEAHFSQPLLPGESATLVARHVAMRDGARQVELNVESERGVLCTANATVAAPRTAYLFTGQGAQSQGMGMEAYARSAAARAVWEQADRYCRETFGFSILTVVRDNPKTLTVSARGGPASGRRYSAGACETVRHPQGVLYLTQFTQVALTVVALAGVAEMREAGCYVEGAMFAGHSLGEYSALAAVEILPLEEMMSIVYQRGLTMQHFVPRDAHGVSPYRMAVIRPNVIGLSDEALQHMVDEIAKGKRGFAALRSQQALEIVNYNIAGEQYSVTGDVPLLQQLDARLCARAVEMGVTKKAMIWLDGIDVPFHSTVLRDGVDAFRQTLHKTVPATVDPDLLVGRYIPNVNAIPFALTKTYLRDVYRRTGSPVVKAMLANPPARPEVLARKLMIELLAYQFASPVQWIETQQIVLEAPEWRVQQIVEVGPQPVLANMARRSLQHVAPRIDPPRIAHIEQDRREVFWLYEDAAVEEDVAISRETIGDGRLLRSARNDTAVLPDDGRRTTDDRRPTTDDRRPATVLVADDGRRTTNLVADDGRRTTNLVDEPLSIQDTLINLMALKCRVRPDEVALHESIEQLTGGNSARRNEVLADLGAEFNIGAIDDAHNKPLRELISVVGAASKYQTPGSYFRVAADQAMKASLAIGRTQVMAYLAGAWGLGDGRVLALMNLIPVAVRTGNSNRKGLLSPLGLEQRLGTVERSHAWIDQLVGWYGELKGIDVPRPSAGGSAGVSMVDAAALTQLEAKYFGHDGLLGRVSRELLKASGQDPYAPILVADEELLESNRQLALYRRALGPQFERVMAPVFDEQKAVSFTGHWNWAKRDVVELYCELRRPSSVVRRPFVEEAASGVIARRPAALRSLQAPGDVAISLDTMLRIVRSADAEALKTIRYYISRAKAEGCKDTTLIFERLARDVERALESVPKYRSADSADLLGDLLRHTPALRSIMPVWRSLSTRGLSLEGQCIVCTGASPGSIAAEVAVNALEAGARVVVSTTGLRAERAAWWRTQYHRHASRGAELHLIPANQGSQEDCGALIAWATAQCGQVDALYPFGAVRELGDLTVMDPGASTATWRVMVQGVEWLIAAVAKGNSQRMTNDGRRTTVILPGSPNHGKFGGDGAYGEAKAALEVLTHRWSSEQSQWGQWVTLVGARIGWTCGTGLMSANDLIAKPLEHRTGCRTFSTEEMGMLLTGLLHPKVVKRAEQSPLWMDLTGGFDKILNVGAVVKELQSEVRDQSPVSSLQPTKPVTDDRRPATPFARKADPRYFSFPCMPTQDRLAALPHLSHLDPHDVYVVVGYGEVSPYGSARTRWAVESGRHLSHEACLELAWITGRISFADRRDYVGWVDTATDAPIEEADMKARFEEELLQQSGIRIVEPALHGFDPQAMTVYADIQLEEEFVFPVESMDQGASFLAKYPEQAEIVRSHNGAETLAVRLKKGAVLKVPKAVRLPRYVAGQIPTGWDPTRYGIPQELVAQIDRNTLFNFVATAEAFLSMGMTPEQLREAFDLHRIGNAQGGGMGGLQSLDHLFHDFREARPRKGDTLQETLINTIAAWVTQSYVGGMGPTVHPVGACATALVSVDTAVNLLATDKADFLVAGGYDDLSAEGVIGFHDMEATANTDAMVAKGIPVKQISRPNDRRRGGFVESHGGGTLLITRLSRAAALGLPIYAVVGFTATHSDGLHTSIPAPGLGLLGMVKGRSSVVGCQSSVGGEGQSPLGGALAKFGLTADDIAAVSKHDTSTQANDPNENALHHRVQEALGRSAGHPLLVHSQKALLGHAKGGAGAWQANAAIQMLNSGIVPGNPNLEDVDPAMRVFSTCCFSERPVHVGDVRAVMFTSLGFGHVGAAGLFIHPDYALRLLADDAREAYAERRAEREAWSRTRSWENLMEQQPAFIRSQ